MTEAFKLVGKLVVDGADKTKADLKGVSKEVDKTQAGLDKGTKGAGSFGSSLAGMAAKAAVASAAVAGVAKSAEKIFELGKEGAAIKQTATSFEGLTTSIGGNVDMLAELRAASMGTVDDTKLMASTTALLSGTSGELSRQLQNATPQLMEMAKAANKLNPTLGDTTYMYESLALGIKRGSPMILDNLGITVKIEEANKRYAESIGLSADALTKEQQQMALLNAVLEKGNILIQQAGGAAGAATDGFSKFEAATKNLGDSIKSNLAGPVGWVVGGLADMISGMSDAQREALGLAAAVLREAESYEEYVTRTKEAVEAQRMYIDGQGNLRASNGEVLEQNYLLNEAKWEEGDAIQRAREAAEQMGDTRREAILENRALRTTEEGLMVAQEEAAKARTEAVASINEYAAALEAARGAAAGLLMNQTGLNESLKFATNADLAKVAIQQLNDSLKNGEIDGKAYTTMVEDVQLSFGMATPQSLALAKNIGTITKAAEDGIIPADKLSEAITALRTDSVDGTVDLTKVLTGAGAAAEEVTPFLEAVEKVKEAQSDLLEDSSEVGNAAEVGISTVERLDEKLANATGNTREMTKAAGEYETQMRNLKAQIDKLNDKTVTITVLTDGEVPVFKEEQSTGDAAKRTASGIQDYVVPGGYYGDSWPVMAQTGERVTVEPANARGRGGRGSLTVYGNLSVILQGGEISAEQILAQTQVG